MTEEGNIIYYSDYNMYGGQKKNRQDGWTCCTGTRPLLVAEMQRLIYFEENADLFVSQYTPSTLHWNREGVKIEVRQDTSFPLKDSTALTLSLSSPAAFSIHLRMPQWLAGTMEIKCNGVVMPALVDKNGWLTVSSEWHDGDSLTITLPQDVWMHSFDPVKKGPNAFLHGPVVLAAEYTGVQTPNDWMDVQSLTRAGRFITRWMELIQLHSGLFMNTGKTNAISYIMILLRMRQNFTRGDSKRKMETVLLP